jgi:hypothetical protein
VSRRVNKRRDADLKALSELPFEQTFAKLRLIAPDVANAYDVLLTASLLKQWDAQFWDPATRVGGRGRAEALR